MTEKLLHGPYSTDRFGAKIYGSDKDGSPVTVLDVRGWGYLTGMGHGALKLSQARGAEEQIAFAERVVAALNEAEGFPPY